MFLATYWYCQKHNVGTLRSKEVDILKNTHYNVLQGGMA
jgi:hypothetical protein